MAIRKTLVIAAGVIFSIVIWGCENPNVKKGKEYYEAGDHAKAMVYFQDAIADDPENFEAHFNLSKAYKELDMLAHMLSEYKLAYNLDSTNLDLLEAYGHFSFDNRFGNDSKKQAYGMFIRLLESNQAEKYSDAILAKITYMRYSYKILVDGIEISSRDESYYKDRRLVYTPADI